MKLIACLIRISRGLERPGRIGVIYLAIIASILDGIHFPNRNSRQICVATEKFTLLIFAKNKSEELLKLAKEKGTPILENVAKEVKEKTVVVIKEVLAKLEKEEPKKAKNNKESK